MAAPSLSQAKATKAATPTTRNVVDSATSIRWFRWPVVIATLEPFAFIVLIMVFAWWIEPRASREVNLGWRIALGLIPVASSLAHRDRLRDLGLSFTTLGRSAREVGAGSIAFAGLILLLGASTGHRPPPRSIDMNLTLFLYPVWALWQQFALHGFVYRRLLQSWRVPRAAAAGAALLFGAVHLPNTTLVAFTIVGGFTWCRLFHRAPNLFTLSLSHAALALLLQWALPPEWLHNLRIGPGYWEWR